MGDGKTDIAIGYVTQRARVCQTYLRFLSWMIFSLSGKRFQESKLRYLCDHHDYKVGSFSDISLEHKIF